MIRLKAIDARAPLSAREDFIRSAGSHCPAYVLVSTCRRLDLYAGDGEPAQGVAEHLFRVASGLNSPMPGEKAVLGQVKRSYLQAVAEGHVSSGLHQLFQSALRTGKRVRTETEISRGAVSYGQAAVLLLKTVEPQISDKRLVVIGAHAMNRGIIGLLKRAGCRNICLTNRTQARGFVMAAELGCGFFPFPDLPREAARADVIISATSSPDLILTPENFRPARPRVLIDLAMPRDIDERIGDMEGIRLFDLSHVEASVEQNRSRRAFEAAKAEQIIAGELERFHVRKRNFVPC